MLSSRAVLGRSLPLVTILALGGCSSDADGVFGESSGTGATSGGDGGSGDGGSTGASPSGPSSTTGAASTTGGSSSSGEGGAGSTSSTGEGAAASSTSSGEGGATVSSSASGPTCGDGARNGAEDCDGADLGGATCNSLGFPGPGTLTCSDACTFDPSGCNRCGNGEVNGGEDCDDGGNTPGDGCDAQCNFEGVTCAQPISILLDRGDLVSIATTNAAGPEAPNECLDAKGPGRIIEVMPQSDGFLTAWIRRDGTTFDSSLRMGYSCSGDNIFVCADSFDPGSNDPVSGGEVGSMFVSEGQPAWVFVEAFAAGEEGDFVVELTLSRGDCSEPVELPIERGSPQGIVAWGFNDGQGNDVVGSCGGNGEDVTYRLRNMGQASPVDVVITPVEGFSYNPVLHSREGFCDEDFAETECSATSGLGQSEQLVDLIVGVATYVHADAAQNSDGGWRMRVTPPQP